MLCLQLIAGTNNIVTFAVVAPPNGSLGTNEARRPVYMQIRRAQAACATNSPIRHGCFVGPSIAVSEILSAGHEQEPVSLFAACFLVLLGVATRCEKRLYRSEIRRAKIHRMNLPHWV